MIVPPTRAEVLAAGFAELAQCVLESEGVGATYYCDDWMNGYPKRDGSKARILAAIELARRYGFTVQE